MNNPFRHSYICLSPKWQLYAGRYATCGGNPWRVLSSGYRVFIGPLCIGVAIAKRTSP